MEFALMNREQKAIQLYSLDLAGIRDLYSEILAAQEEVGGTLTFRAKVPAGGGKSFDILTGNEDMDTSTPSLVGVVIHTQKCNAYFDEDNVGNTPPICSSEDSVCGTIRESGEIRYCNECPLNKFNSSAKGSGKACKNMIRLYVLIEGSPVPIMLTLPPTSIRAWQSYRTSVLAMNRLRPEEAVTEFTLGTATNASGVKYSVVKPKLLGRLSEEMSQVATFFAQGFKSTIELSADDYNRGDGEDSHA